MLVDFGQTWLRSDKVYRNRQDLDQIRHKLGQRWLDFDKTWVADESHLAEFGQQLIEIGLSLADIRPIWTKLGQTLPSSGRPRCKCGGHWPKLERYISTRLTEIGQTSNDVDPHWVELGPSWVDLKCRVEFDLTRECEGGGGGRGGGGAGGRERAAEAGGGRRREWAAWTGWEWVSLGGAGAGGHGQGGSSLGMGSQVQLNSGCDENPMGAQREKRVGEPTKVGQSSDVERTSISKRPFGTAPRPRSVRSTRGVAQPPPTDPATTSKQS